MNFKFVIKTIATIFIFLIVSTFLVSSCANAAGADKNGSDNFDLTKFEESEGATDGEVEEKVNTVAQTIVAVLRVASVTIAIAILLVIAMRYMLSAPGDRADIKKYAVNYIIGAVVLFGATGIISILVQLSEVFGS